MFLIFSSAGKVMRNGTLIIGGRSAKVQKSNFYNAFDGVCYIWSAGSHAGSNKLVGISNNKTLLHLHSGVFIVE